MNPYDKYSSDNEIPRLTDDLIRKKLKEVAHISLSTLIMMALAIPLAVWVMTGAMLHLKSATLLGNYPAVIWTLIVLIWLVAGGFLAYYVRDYLKDRADYGARYHIVKAELNIISRDEYQGMEWRYLNGRMRRRPVFRDVFYFDGMEKCIVTKKNLERAAEGDEYLIVVFDQHPTKPVLIFRTDTYRWP